MDELTFHRKETESAANFTAKDYLIKSVTGKLLKALLEVLTKALLEKNFFSSNVW